MSGDEITQISVGGLRIGIKGLSAALEQVASLAKSSDEEIGQALIDILQRDNYIPAASRGDYVQALVREFKRGRGEQVEEERRGLHIRILGAGCPACQSLTQLMFKVVTDLGVPADVEHVTDYGQIAALGVLSVPALLIDDRLVVAGRVPRIDELKELLCKAWPGARST